MVFAIYVDCFNKLWDHLNEWLHQPEVFAAHAPLQVEDSVGHTIDGEWCVPRNKTEPSIVQSFLHESFSNLVHFRRWSSTPFFYTKKVNFNGRWASLFMKSVLSLNLEKYTPLWTEGPATDWLNGAHRWDILGHIRRVGACAVPHADGMLGTRFWG